MKAAHYFKIPVRQAITWFACGLPELLRCPNFKPCVRESYCLPLSSKILIEGG